MTVVEFEVIGVPHPQGDKSAITIGGRARLIEGKSNNARAKHHNWRAAVATAAKDIADQDGPFPDGPLKLTIEFRFPMPASRPKKVRALGQTWKMSAPDTDKLLRATGDALTNSGLIIDDSRLVHIDSSKVETTGWTGAIIRIETIGDQP